MLINTFVTVYYLFMEVDASANSYSEKKLFSRQQFMFLYTMNEECHNYSDAKMWVS